MDADDPMYKLGSMMWCIQDGPGHGWHCRHTKGHVEWSALRHCSRCSNCSPARRRTAWQVIPVGQHLPSGASHLGLLRTQCWLLCVQKAAVKCIMNMGTSSSSLRVKVTLPSPRMPIAHRLHNLQQANNAYANNARVNTLACHPLSPSAGS